MEPQADDMLAEVKAGVGEASQLPLSGNDVLQRLLLLQTRMLSQLAPKPSDPLNAALGGASAKLSSLNARGSAARDAYVKLVSTNRAQVALEIRRLAAQELGVSAENPPSNLLRDYAERKLPSGDFRTMSMLASFAGHMWQSARETDNPDLESWASMLMLFLDQTCSEGGKTQLSWLLMALPEPNYSVLVRKPSGVRPFSRICPSLWMSANVAFLREMDWLGTRMSTAQPSNAPADQTEGDPGANPKKPRKLRRPAPKALTDAPSGSAGQ